MSRIILSRWSTGEERVVVGWDRMAQGAFWQEFNQEPEDGDYPDDWVEVLRNGGTWPGLSLRELQRDFPDDLRQLLTPRVTAMLEQHAADPKCGYIKIDLSKDSVL